MARGDGEGSGRGRDIQTDSLPDESARSAEEPTQPAGLAQPGELAQPDELAQPGEPIEPVGSGDSGDSAEPADSAMPPKSSRPAVPPASSEATRHSMQANRSKDTKPELVVRAYLRDAGLSGYRLQWKREFGRPDVAYPGRRLAIFVNGCFWHRCPYCHPSQPRSNVEFWEAKFARNRERDERHVGTLLERGWTVIVIWECRLTKKRVRRTMDVVVHEVRAASPVRVKADERTGKLVVLGRLGVRGPYGLAANRVRSRGRLRRRRRGAAGEGTGL